MPKASASAMYRLLQGIKQCAYCINPRTFFIAGEMSLTFNMLLGLKKKRIFRNKKGNIIFIRTSTYLLHKTLLNELLFLFFSLSFSI